MMTSNELELQFEEQMNKPKVAKIKEPEINEPKAQDASDEFVLDDWD